MDVSTILSTIDTYIKTNGNGEITGQVLQDVLHYLVNGLNSGKQDTLIGSGAGQNIKTINNQSLPGAGNITAGMQATIVSCDFDGSDVSNINPSTDENLLMEIENGFRTTIPVNVTYNDITYAFLLMLAEYDGTDYRFTQINTGASLTVELTINTAGDIDVFVNPV